MVLSNPFCHAPPPFPIMSEGLGFLKCKGIMWLPFYKDWFLIAFRIKIYKTHHDQDFVSLIYVTSSFSICTLCFVHQFHTYLSICLPLASHLKYDDGHKTCPHRR